VVVVMQKSSSVIRNSIPSKLTWHAMQRGANCDTTMSQATLLLACRPQKTCIIAVLYAALAYREGEYHAIQPVS